MAQKNVQKDVYLYDEPIIVNLNEVEKEYEEEITEGIKVKIKKLKHYNDKYDVEFGPYIIRVNNPYYARMAIYALLMCEKKLLANGYVEMTIDWDEKDWKIWDYYRIFDFEKFKIFRNGDPKAEIGDALIDLEVRRIFAPLADNKLKVYIKAFMMPHPVIE
jgi:hypothetical protein